MKYPGIWIDAHPQFGLNKVDASRGDLSTQLLYAAPIWSSALPNKAYACSAISVHRRVALHVVCAYHADSQDPICIANGMLPIDWHQMYVIECTLDIDPHIIAIQILIIEKWHSNWLASHSKEWCTQSQTLKYGPQESTAK